MKKLVKALLLSGLCLYASSCVIATPSKWNEYHYDNSGNYSFGNAKIDGEITSVDVDWLKGKVNFVTTEDTNVSFTESCSESLSRNEKVHYWYDVRNKELKIKFFASRSHIDFDEISKELTIYIPTTYTSLSINAKTISADINSSVPAANNYNMDTVSGYLRITDADNIDNIEFDSVSGNVNVNCNTINSFDSDTTSGDMNITTNDASRINVNSVSGDLIINIPETLGFYVEYDTIGKNFSTNAEVKIDGKKCYYKDEKLKIDFDSVSGDIKVNVR